MSDFKYARFGNSRSSSSGDGEASVELGAIGQRQQSPHGLLCFCFDTVSQYLFSLPVLCLTDVAVLLEYFISPVVGHHHAILGESV